MAQPGHENPSFDGAASLGRVFAGPAGTGGVLPAGGNGAETREHFGQLVFDYSMDCIKILDLDGRLLSINPAGLRLLEIGDFSPFLKASWFDFLPDAEKDKAAGAVAAARGGGIGTCQACGPTLTGRLKWWDVIVAPIRDAQGHPERLLAISRDITERRLAEQARSASDERFRLVTEATREGIWDWNIRTGEVYYSPAYFIMLGYEPGQFPPHYRSWLDLVHPEDRDRAFRVNQDCVEGVCETFELESRMQARDGEWRWILGRGRCIERDAAGFAVRLVGTHMDITDRKRDEETLRAANAALAEAARHKDEFLAMLAHELRNPLAPIRNAVLLLRHAAGDPATARQHEIIDRQITHMARLLDDLLDVSRITRGKVELKRQPLRLAEVLAQAIETTEPLIQARRHAFIYTPPPPDLWVEADLDRLAQSIGNLLANAAKYTESGGRVWLEADRVGGAAVVRVRDTGIGIAPEMLPRIFDLFTQAERTLDRTQGGLGIGLTLARNLVQMHGGTLEAFSGGMGQGSEFVVRLPLYEVSARVVDAPAAMGEPLPLTAALRRVLVVDDVADTAESMAELIEVWGHQTSTAYDGPAALEEAALFKPNVVLLDIGLPGMDGYEVARQLRRQLDPGLLLIALTGYGQESDVLAARAAGFDFHLVKPVDLAVLRRLIEVT